MSLKSVTALVRSELKRLSGLNCQFSNRELNVRRVWSEIEKNSRTSKFFTSRKVLPRKYKFWLNIFFIEKEILWFFLKIGLSLMNIMQSLYCQFRDLTNFIFFEYEHLVFNNINHYNLTNFDHHKKFQLRKSRRMKENLMLKIFTLGLTVLAGVHGKSAIIS